MTVEQVHNDFYSAQDRLLKDAERIISRPRVDLTMKAERVNKLGFTASKPAVTASRVVENYNQARSVIDSITYFKKKYPLNKFITEKEVERLCKKYNLVLADCGRYTGDIPEKNLSEIERFKLHKEDFTEDPSREWIGFALDLAFDYDPFTGKIKASERKKQRLEPTQKPFKIVAPIKDLNIDRSELKGHKLENYVPDPVVLQPVKGGYLIITAWGEEASDPIVVNEIHN